MSGSAGLAAARKRRSINDNINNNILDAQQVQSTNAQVQSSVNYDSLHPSQKLQLHEKKLREHDSKINELIPHIESLGEGFIEHKTQVSEAIPQIQNAIEQIWDHLKLNPDDMSMNLIDSNNETEQLLAQITELTEENAKLKEHIANMEKQSLVTTRDAETLTEFQDDTNIETSSDSLVNNNNDDELDETVADTNALIADVASALLTETSDTLSSDASIVADAANMLSFDNITFQTSEMNN